MPKRLIAPARTAGLVLFALLTACGGETTPTPPDTTRNLAVQAGDNQTAVAGTPVATAPAVRVTNGSGAAVAGAAITFSVASGGGSVTGGAATTDANGVASAGGWTLGQTAGANTLTAQISGGTASVTFTATGNAGPPAAATKAAGDAQTANTRQAVAVAPAVLVVDQFANPVAGASVAFAVTAGGGTVTGGTTVTGGDGRAAVGSWVLGATGGPNALTATITGGTVAPIVFTATGREVVFQPGQDTVVQGGTLQVTRLVIPAGRTVTVMGDLVLNVDSVLIVDGTLTGNCVAVTIAGEQSVTIAGTLNNACADPNADPASISIVAKGGYDISGTITTSGDFDVTNDPTLVDGDFPPETAPAQFRQGSAQLAGTICGFSATKVPPQATSGSSTGAVGGPGRNARTFVGRCRGDFSIGGLIGGQDGGDGGNGSDMTGSANATGGRGGNGGDLKILATGIVALGATSVLRSGRGGDGGTAVAQGGDNGTGTRAFSATAKGGRGGDPGLITVRAGDGIQVSTGAKFTLGRGGHGGDATATGAAGDNATAEKAAQHGGHATAEGGAAGGLDPAKLRKSGDVLGGPEVDGGNGGLGGEATAIAGKGGDSNIEQHPDGGHGGDFTATGGDGGDARARDLQGNPVGFGGSGGAVAMRGGMGGIGFDGCSVDPNKAGGKGGNGGSADGTNGAGGKGAIAARDGSPGQVIYTDAGNGGNGGDGAGPGDGGMKGNEGGFQLKAGTVPVKNGTNFEDGEDGDPCPQLIALSLTELSVTHIVFESPCPQVIGTVRVTNISDAPITLTTTVLGTVVVTVQGGGVTLQPGQFVDLQVAFNCLQAFSFTGQIRVTATPLTSSVRVAGAPPAAAPPPQDAFVEVTGIVRMRAVRLAQQLGPFAANTVIQRNRITNWLFFGAHPPNCAVDHLHSTIPAGILIDSQGPFPDPAQTACGYGEVILQTIPAPAGGPPIR